MADPNHHLIELSVSDYMPTSFLAVFGQEGLDAVLTGVARKARSKWIALAKDNLRSTAAAYQKGIQDVVDLPSDPTGATKVITLVGALPNALEQGQSAYDMHDTLLGPNVPMVIRGSGLKGKIQKKDGSGFYRAIPFRHQTPSTMGLLGAVLGKAYEENLGVDEAKALGLKIYDAVKRLTPSMGEPGQKITWGSRLPAGLAPKLKEAHRVDIYAGMVRQTKFYEKVTQAQYTTFRTISTGSSGWQRQATPGIHLAEQVRDFIETKVLTQAFEALFKGATGQPF